jgi:hypothetical protein
MIIAGQVVVAAATTTPQWTARINWMGLTGRDCAGLVCFGDFCVAHAKPGKFARTL